MGIYTGSGDEGETGLGDGPRRWKDDARVEAYGSVDELNSLLGAARAESLPPEIDSLLERVQQDLFWAGAVLAAPDPAAPESPPPGDERIAALEAAIDHWDERLPPLRQFILPGGVRSAAVLQHARTVCRRAERRLVALARRPEEPVPPSLLKYFNRLGDLLFVLARAVNHAAGVAEAPWRK